MENNDFYLILLPIVFKQTRKLFPNQRVPKIVLNF